MGVYVKGVVAVLWKGRERWVKAGSPNQKSLTVIYKMRLIKPLS